LKKIKTGFIQLLLLLMASSFSLCAQDLIVTNSGDSLNCRITKIKTDYIYFTFKHKDEIRSTLLPSDKVRYYQYDYFQEPEVPVEKVKTKQFYPHFKAGIYGGWSYRTASLPDNISADLENYLNDLKKGYHYGLDFTFYFMETQGFGLRYSAFITVNEIANVYITQPDNTIESGKLSDDISIFFVGPFYSLRLLNNNKRNSFISTIGLGYLGYVDEAVLITEYEITGNSVGLIWDVGYEIGISNTMAIGFQFSYTLGTLTKYTKTEGTLKTTIELEDGEYENLSRIDLSIALRFNK
jgi:hypothetical protein